MRIPEFSRTVLPDRSVGIARAEVARAPYEQKANELEQAGKAIRNVEASAADYMYKEAQARNATAVNEGVMNFKKQAADLEVQRRQERMSNPKDFHKDFDKELEGLSNSVVDSMPSEAAKAALRGSLSTQRTSMYEQNLGWERKREVETFAGSIDRAQETASSVASQRGAAGESIDDLMKDMSATAVAGSTIVAPEKVDSIRIAGQRRVVESAINGAIEAGNVEYAYKLLNQYGANRGGFNASIDVVMQHEGGFTPVDGASEAPAIYGINRKWHPEAYDEAKKITDEKGQEAGVAYAKQFYKKEFWDKNGIGSLPAESQAVVLDGVVNHTSSFGKKLVEAAKGGASVDELVDMRRKEYERLAKANPEKYQQSMEGWMNRLGTFTTESVLPAEKLQGLEKAADTATLKLDEQRKTQRIINEAQTNWDVFNKFADGKLTLTQVSDLENSGKITSESADFMRQRIIKSNPISTEEQSQVYTELFDQVMQLGIHTKNGEIIMENGDAKLEDLVRLQQRVTNESIRGVKGLKPLVNKLSPAIMILAKQETGSSGEGMDAFFDMFRTTNPYDKGYEKIQNFLESQDSEDNMALKSDMLSTLIERADRLPQEILDDQAKLDVQVTALANQVIAEKMKGSIKNIPAPAISYLLDNPTTAPQFDQMFGAGSAARILGND